MKNIEFLPKDKEDTQFVEKLRLKSISEIKDNIPDLLEWVQDGNWPQASYIMEYFRPHINEIDDELIKILKGNDATWKYWLLLGLIKNSGVTPNQKLLSELDRLASSPTADDKEEGIDDLSKEILDKF